MTDVYSNIQNGKYENTSKYPIGSSKDPAIAKERAAYKAQQVYLDDLFYNDCCADLDLDPGKDSSRKIFSRAWEESHSSGLNEVYENMGELLRFVNEVHQMMRYGD